MTSTIINVHVYIISDFPITYRNASVLCQSECACLYKPVNKVVFFVKMMKITTQKGEHSSKYTESSLKQKERITVNKLYHMIKQETLIS